MLPNNFWGDLVGNMIMTAANGLAALLLGPLTLLASIFEDPSFLTDLLALLFPA
jgi:hypothetical protein